MCLYGLYWQFDTLSFSLLCTLGYSYNPAWVWCLGHDVWGTSVNNKDIIWMYLGYNLLISPRTIPINASLKRICIGVLKFCFHCYWVITTCYISKCLWSTASVGYKNRGYPFDVTQNIFRIITGYLRVCVKREWVTSAEERWPKGESCGVVVVLFVA